ncbi:MAG: hypothetical protein IRZ09_00470 [Variibacter sp.]|nr:hypothetical protein [Variibacter sp.]
MSDLHRLAGEETPVNETGPSQPEATDTPPKRNDRSAAPGEVRPLEADDIAAVAALFQKSFRDPAAPAPASLGGYLHELFLEHPWRDPELPSRVHVAAGGTIDGFIGVLPARMQFRGRTIRAAVAGSLMVHDPGRDPLAGARLLRAFFNGPQDLSFSETANPLSQGMWERLGGFAAPGYSMEWVRLLRPFGAGLSAVARTAPLAKVMRPLAAGLDRLAAPLAARALGRNEDRAGAACGFDAGEDELLQAVPELAEAFPLRPTWDAAALRWVLAHARAKEQHGPAVRRIVRGRGGRLLGCYIYFGRPRDIAWVLQILARPGAAGPVIDDLFAHAAQQGSVAVRGRAQPDLLDALLRRKCLMLHRASTVVHARDPDLLQAVRSGEALLNGLAGESWTRLIGGSFA